MQRLHCTGSIIATLFLINLATLFPHTLLAAPRVHFDTPGVVACREIPPTKETPALPGGKLIEARIQISSLIGRGSEEDLLQFFYRIECPHRTMQVYDYLPRTTLASKYEGSIKYEEKDQTTNAVRVGATTLPFEMITGGNANGEIVRTDTTTVRYELLPPKHQLSASGTLRRGAGVYFKLKPSSRTSLEGGKEFVLRMHVPKTWRGGYLRLQCVATGFYRGLVSQFDEQEQCGRASFTLALHLQDDEPAAQAARQFVAHENALRRAAAEHRQAISQQSLPLLRRSVGTWLGVVEPQPPADWLQQIEQLPPGASPPEFTGRLPKTVQRTVQDYHESKNSVHALTASMQ